MSSANDLAFDDSLTSSVTASSRMTLVVTSDSKVVQASRLPQQQSASDSDLLPRPAGRGPPCTQTSRSRTHRSAPTTQHPTDLSVISPATSWTTRTCIYPLMGTDNYSATSNNITTLYLCHFYQCSSPNSTAPLRFKSTLLTSVAFSTLYSHGLKASFYRAMLCIARTMLSQDVRLSAGLSVYLSHAGILSKRLNTASNCFHIRLATLL